MSGLLDTSVIVRYLTGDPPKLADRAAHIIDSTIALHITDVVLVEVAYVLISVYKMPRAAVVDALIALLQRTNIRLFALDKTTVFEALLLCQPSGRVAFADALIWAVARSSDTPTVYTFDKRFPTDGVQLES
ncbi:MAG: PIN domain-containing protein [Candidatus Competibacteraceae bacterium]|nr:PIN domain-containing protein [Candidatus Competibacteraceae bacterium]